jgi:hypothetical protein
VKGSMCEVLLVMPKMILKTLLVPEMTMIYRENTASMFSGLVTYFRSSPIWKLSSMHAFLHLSPSRVFSMG